MKSVLVPLTLVASLVALSSHIGSASADWSHTKEFQYSKTASIRIVEPEGYKVTVGEQTDTVPAVFKFANENNYYNVVVTAPDGTTWKKKIEVRAHKETVLRVKHAKAKKKDSPKTTDKKVRSYIGNVKNTCRRRSGVGLRFDFLLDGEKKASRALNAGQSNDLTIEAGTYEVRVFSVTKKTKSWKFIKTFKQEVKADGWKFHPGC